MLLERYSYSTTETEGLLTLPDSRVLNTIERPWVPGTAPGGTPFKSCVPDGLYMLAPFKRPSGEQAYILWNEDLGVYKFPEHHAALPGRDLILIHTGNWVSDVVGCIAPGGSRRPMVNPKTDRLEQAVSGSAVAMSRLRSAIGTDFTERTLEIRSVTGARDDS